MNHTFNYYCYSFNLAINLVERNFFHPLTPPTCGSVYGDSTLVSLYATPTADFHLLDMSHAWHTTKKTPIGIEATETYLD